jgi:L,D-transpeptidase-like protein/putative peptidoglycan binding protein/PKD domain-containing protein
VVRRIGLASLAALVFAPVSHAAGPCGVTATPVRGSAPLTVTFTAACTSTAYTWSFGDGQSGAGQSVQHAYAAGAWHATLATDAGTDAAPSVTAIAVSLTGPAHARYAQYVTLRASVTPRVPVTLHGRRFVNGKLRVRVLGTAPWRANALGVRSKMIRILVTPKLVVRTVGRAIVGGHVRVVATLHPANAGTIAVPRVDTSRAHVAHVAVRSRPRPGWVAVDGEADVAIVQPDLSLGARGASVRELERRLQELHYAVRADGYFGDDDAEALYAFQKVEGLARTGAVDAAVWGRLSAAHPPAARFGGDHVEIDKTRQVLFVVRGGQVSLVVATSTGATGNTPLGIWHVYRKVTGFDWVLYYPNYFLRGFAIHGYPDVPPYPASHGCARIPMWVATTVYAQIGYGSAVYVYA